MTDRLSYRKGFVNADFLSHNYRISGEVDISVNPVADLLNDPLKSYVKVENVYISPIQAPADIKGNFKHGQLSKDNITMAVLHREEDGLPKRQAYGSYIGYVVHEVFLTVPGFEVQGQLAISATLDLESLLVLSAERFIPVAEATATVSLSPDVQFKGGMILVNRDHIGIFCMSRK